MTTITRVQRAFGHIANRYHKAGFKGKLIIWSIILINIILISSIIIITPHRIGEWVEVLAGRLRRFGRGGWGGMVVLAGCVVIASHPPFFGFAASLTLIGFTFGNWPGMGIAMCGNMIGAAVAFWSIRTFFLQWMRQFGSERSERWEAFSHVVKAKGTILIIMIRWCPVPWAIGNGLFASIDSVSFPQFMLANLLVQPRLLVPVFIGSRLHSLTGDGEANDPVKKWVNLASILIGMSISFITGWFIYKATLQKMRELGGVDPEEEEEAIDVLERNALLGDFSGSGSESEEEEGRLRSRRRDGERV